MRDPNRPKAGASVKGSDAERDLKSNSADAKHDGYSVCARRPRSRFSDEIVSKEKADRVDSYSSNPIDDDY